MKIQRRFMLGQEWLYLKVYTGPKLAEDLLLNEIYEAVEQLYAGNIIRKFFYVRFSDESYHLRLRFCLADTSGTGMILQIFSEKLSAYVENRLVAKVVADTYNRELERYGLGSIEDIETVFSIDSWETLCALRFLSAKEDQEAYWIWGIRYMDYLLDKFQLSLEEKYQLYELYFQNYSHEFGKAKPTKAYLQGKFREHRKQIEEAFLDNSAIPPKPDKQAVSERVLEEGISNILRLRNMGKLEVPFMQLLQSILHMHYNRLFRTGQRAHEYVLYFMLSNFYKSLMARKTKEAIKTETPLSVS